MMKKNYCYAALFLLVLMAGAVATAGERTVPVDIFVLVDKSLSMAESQKFPGLKKWTEDQLTGQMLVEGDWLTIYQFYGEAKNVLTLTINNEADKERVKNVFDSIRPDGRFTDIGLALDTIKEALDGRTSNGRYKIMLLLTDLRQEAPWTSRYPGVIDPFKSPYLAEARTVDHGGWYEITLDMDIHDDVVMLSRKLYKTIENLEGASHEISTEDFGDSFDVTAQGTESTAETSLQKTTDEAAVSITDTGDVQGNSGLEDRGDATESGSELYSSAENSTQVVKQKYTEGGTGIARMIDTDENPEENNAGKQNEARQGINISGPVFYIGGIILLLILLIVVIVLARARKPSDDKKNPAKAVDLMNPDRWNT